MEQAVTQFQVKIICNESTGFDEVTNYFATEADMRIYIAFDFDEDKLRIFTFNRYIY